MERKVFGLFSGTHLTVLAGLAILAPTALVAAVTYSPVSIVDPNTGTLAFVDGARRLSVFDPIAGYANNPLNYVRISGSASLNNNFATVYTPPAGKAFIIRAININHYLGVTGNDNYGYFYANSTNFIGGFDDPNAVGSYSVNLGNGYYLHSGEPLTLLGSNFSNANIGIM